MPWWGAKRKEGKVKGEIKNWQYYVRSRVDSRSTGVDYPCLLVILGGATPNGTGIRFVQADARCQLASTDSRPPTARSLLLSFVAQRNVTATESESALLQKYYSLEVKRPIGASRSRDSAVPFPCRRVMALHQPS